MQIMERERQLREFFGLKLTPAQQRNYDQAVAQLAGEMDSDVNKGAKSVSEGLLWLTERIKELQAEIAARAAKIRQDNKEAGWQKPAEAVDKFIEKISFRASATPHLVPPLGSCLVQTLTPLLALRCS